MEKTCEVNNRIIVALDMNSFDKMKEMVDELGDAVSFYKVGMELYYSVGQKAVEFLKSKNKKVFLDLKLHDIPNTVGHSVYYLTKLGVDLLTVHAAGGSRMLESAVHYAKIAAEEEGIEVPKILGVTVLTAIDEEAWKEIGSKLSIKDSVINFAKIAKKSGLDGVIASPKEARMIREVSGDEFLIVTPGIRPKFASANDQKRITTPKEAINNGATLLVIGRPITQAENPRHAAELINEEIREAI